MAAAPYRLSAVVLFHKIRERGYLSGETALGGVCAPRRRQALGLNRDGRIEPGAAAPFSRLSHQCTRAVLRLSFARGIAAAARDAGILIPPKGLH